MTDPFRCSIAAAGRPDDLAGTASTVRAFLLVEEPGPWGTDAFRDSRIAHRDAIREAAGLAGVRPLLVRRQGRSDTAGGRRVFAAYADSHAPWLETAVVDDPRELLDLDLAALARGDSLGLDRTDDVVLGVCTHGRHDACCAEQGRPVAAALDAAHPDQTWQVSHIGGDRYAANLLALPHGLYYGRLDPAAAIAVAGSLLAGHLELDHLRGRSGWAMPVQAAEIALRRQLGETALDGVRLRRRTRDGDVTAVVMAAAGRDWSVTVRTTTGPATARLTCRAQRENPLPRHEVLRIEALA